MSEGTPTGPGQPRMPWEPETPEATTPEPPAPSQTGWTPPEPTDPTTAWTPPPVAPPPPAGSPPGQGGLISSAPSGWAPPPRPEVEVAPGLTFADTTSRVVGYIIDGIILLVVISIIAAFLGVATTTTTVTDSTISDTVGGPIGSIIFALIGLAYFVGSWTGGRRATIGQRVMNIQVGNAFDGRPLSLEQAVRRWIGLGNWIGLLAIVPSLYALSGVVQLLWTIILLITTVTSPTKQGLHDRFANSALVRPAGAGSSGLAMACIVIVVILLLLAIVSFVALIFLGGQLSTILSAVGESI